ncbi:MAG: 50S ribosomal protein L13 [Pseudomonadota bacterium]
MRTVTVKPESIVQHWHVVDAKDKILGRLASKIAFRLMGKHKPEYTPNMDLGDNIIVINAELIRVTGNKGEAKQYHHHSEYPGGLKSIVFNKLLAEKPERILEAAIKNMLPKGPLGRQTYKKLHVYAGAIHPHSAQNPETLDI